MKNLMAEKDAGCWSSGQVGSDDDCVVTDDNVEPARRSRGNDVWWEAPRPRVRSEYKVQLCRVIPRETSKVMWSLLMQGFGRAAIRRVWTLLPGSNESSEQVLFFFRNNEEKAPTSFARTKHEANGLHCS